MGQRTTQVLLPPKHWLCLLFGTIIFLCSEALANPGAPSWHPRRTSRTGLDSRCQDDMEKRVDMVRRFNERVCHRPSAGSKPRTPEDWARFGQWAEDTQDDPRGGKSVSWSLYDAAPTLLLDGDFYQFGVFGGKSLEWLQPAFPGTFVWGFDSFTGLPEEQAGVPAITGWAAGNYAAERFGVSPGALEAKLGGPQRARFVKGFYNETLTAAAVRGLGRPMRPAVYVDVDCDLYVSTYQALDWMFEHKLIAAGTLVGYDDWWVMPC
eukprot:CAMPEP_0118926470 /NCGR_PEP_ID=MMETSP1169-20130426/4141_1 /TAXON_ID=36882 /ORGANISM="Pyramimonas obovata, Strain CCMP722" /LENGTH=264 /DNA_ID=CAMNT_0006868025 /DNA_START=285 /DNA_END=1076 /DNA_ORIENTATION=+